MWQRKILAFSPSHQNVLHHQGSKCPLGRADMFDPHSGQGTDQHCMWKLQSWIVLRNMAPAPKLNFHNNKKRQLKLARLCNNNKSRHILSVTFIFQTVLCQCQCQGGDWSGECKFYNFRERSMTSVKGGGQWGWKPGHVIRPTSCWLYPLTEGWYQIFIYCWYHYHLLSLNSDSSEW